MANVTFEMDIAGISEICKSGEMRGALVGEAYHLRNSANKDAYAHGYTGDEGLLPYVAGVKTLQKTAIAWVTTGSNSESIENENQYKSLSNLNH